MCDSQNTNFRVSAIKKLVFVILTIIALLTVCEKILAQGLGASLSYGKGQPDHLKGYRIGLQNFWPLVSFPHFALNLAGYWDLSFAHWQITPGGILTPFYQPSTITIFAISPIIRLQTRKKNFLSTQPFLELGIGASLLSNNYLGHRNLGGQFAFQDLLGIGLRWGTTRAWSLSYHYLHYSNAGFLPPNQGIDVKHLWSLGYEF